MRVSREKKGEKSRRPLLVQSIGFRLLLSYAAIAAHCGNNEQNRRREKQT